MALAFLLSPPIRVAFKERDASGNPTSLNAPAYLELDASLSELHRFENEITQHPVQKVGANKLNTYSDNVRHKPVKLTINGIVSDSKLEYAFLSGGIESMLSSFSFSGQLPLSIVAYDAMVALMKKDQPFDVMTSTRIFPSMYIESLDVPRNAKTGKAFEFSVNLSEIQIIDTEAGVVGPDMAKFDYDMGNVISQPPSTMIIIAATVFLVNLTIALGTKKWGG